MNDNCYDYPQYWDLAFRDETPLEADFIEAVAERYVPGPVRSLFEPGCGGGRLVVEMAARGYAMHACDLSEPSVRYLRRRLRRRHLDASVSCADMTDFRTPAPVDIAFNTMNTFRHLTTERAARTHLESVAASLRVGGVYVLGFHLIPPDAAEEDGERWTARHGQTHVTMSLRVREFDRRSRLETVRFCLRVRSAGRDLRLRSDYRLRLYTAAQFRRLLQSVPALQLRGVFDFWYDLDEPRTFDNELSDSVFILQRV